MIVILSEAKNLENMPQPSPLRKGETYAQQLVSFYPHIKKMSPRTNVQDDIIL